jgi:hypothetical protein
MSPHVDGSHRGRNRRRMLAAPLVVIAAGGIAACGSATGTIVLGSPTTTQCPLEPTTCTTVSVEASSTSFLGVATSSIPPVLGVPTTTSEPDSSTTGPPTSDSIAAPKATLVKTT